MKKQPVTLGSLFDGSGGFPLAGAISGAVPLWASEIEPYPISVTRERFPEMKHLGSVIEINGAEIPPVGIITFGSPCQDMSVAGKRAGMQHQSKGDSNTTRSGLFYEAVRVIREMREATNGEYPTFAVWENVPGTFSSNQGQDFRCVLEELAKVAGGGGVSIPMPADGRWHPAGEIVGDGFSIAWRVLDAQYWVPQRRKRIYLVADFTGERAGKILFEREGMPWDSATCGAQREGTAEDAEGSAGGSDCPERLNQCAAFMGGQGAKAGGIGYAEEIAPTIKSVLSGSNTVPDVVYAVHDKATRNRGGGRTRHDDGAGNGLGVQDDGTMYTLDTACRHGVCYPETARTLTARHDSSPNVDSGQNVVVLDCRNLVGNVEISATLQAKNKGGYSLNFVNPVVYDCRGNGSGDIVPHLTGHHENRVTDYTAICVGNGQLHQTDMGDKTGALNCMHDQQAVITSGKPQRKYIVRRLIPLECGRLQGFPDGWGDTPCKDHLSDDEYQFWLEVRNTHASVNGKAARDYTREQMRKWYNGLHTDSAEYKMWGNGIALPCAAFVLDGVVQEVNRLL